MGVIKGDTRSSDYSSDYYPTNSRLWTKFTAAGMSARGDSRERYDKSLIRLPEDFCRTLVE